MALIAASIIFLSVGMSNLDLVVIFFNSADVPFRAIVMASSSIFCGSDVCEGFTRAIPFR